MITFSHPWWLLALVLVPLGGWQWERFSRLPQGKRRRVAIARMVILLLVIFALAGIGWQTTQPGIDVIAVIDRSDSVSSGTDDRTSEYITDLESRMGAEDRLGVVVFGRNTQVVKTPSDPTGFPLIHVPDPSGTNIGQALQIAAGLISPDRNGRIVLFTDGQENLGSVHATLSQLTERTIPIDVVPTAHIPDEEIVIETFTTPHEVSPGEPFMARAVITSTLDTNATVYLFRNDVLVSEQQVHLSPGRNLIAFSDILDDAGVATYEVRVESPTDTFLENNIGQGLVRTRGPVRVLILAGNIGESEPLYRALQTQGIPVDRHLVTQQSIDARALTNYAAVILHNVSATQMSQSQMNDIAHYVRQTGGGLIIIGGNRSYALGAYGGTPLEEVSPLQIEGPEHLVQPSLAMVLVLDKSGSMSEIVERGSLSKLDLAKEAAIGVAQSLESRDLLGIIAFDSRPQWTVPLQPLQHKDWFAAQTLRVVADGGTHAYPALEDAYRALNDVQAAVKHVILLSDGYTIEADFEALVRRLAADKITVSTVGVGDADQELLQHIARWGDGRYYYTDDPYQIPYIFASETRIVSPPRFVELPTQPILVDGTHFFHGLSDTLPPVDGYAIAHPKDSATLHLMADDGSPLLASWRYGLGRVIAYTSDLTTAWGRAWLDWPSFAPFWAQATRWAMRPDDVHGLQAGLDVRHGEGRIWVDAVNSTGDYLNFLDLTASLRLPDGSSSEVPLEQVGPGRYEAFFVTPAVGTWVATITSDDITDVQPLVATATLPYAEEYRVFGTSMPLLRDIANTTGGQLITGPDELPTVWTHSRDARHVVELWPWLILVALCVFIVDIGMRYVPAGTIRHIRQSLSDWRQEQAHRSSRSLSKTVLQRRAAETQVLPSDSRQRASRDAHSYLARHRKKRQASQDDPTKPVD